LTWETGFSAPTHHAESSFWAQAFLEAVFIFLREEATNIAILSRLASITKPEVSLVKSSPNQQKLCSVFHVTHWKAGSQWISSVLKYAAPRRFIRAKPGELGPLGGPFITGKVYGPVYAPFSRFREFVPEDPMNRVFVVIRDPRDTLVSWYFSLMYSHPEETDGVRECRRELRSMPKSDALAFMACKHLQEVILIQREWIESAARIFRYEDFARDDQATFKQVFDFCGIPVSLCYRRSIVLRHSFRFRTWWRLGRENTKSHLRKGTPGDWINHFDDDLKRLFKSRYGEALAISGYEKDDSW
jgi:hypothetical protein